MTGLCMVHRIPWQRGTTYNDIYVGSAQSTSPENMDMPLLSSTGIRKDYLRKMVHMNARAGPTLDFTRDMVMKSKKETYYPTRTISSDSLGC